MKYIAIDFGSTYVKSALVDLEAARVHSPHVAPMPGAVHCGGLRYELDPEALVGLARSIIAGYAAEYSGSVLGVRISAQMHGFLLSRPDGTPLTPYISWQDTRCLAPSGQGGSYLDLLRCVLEPENFAVSGLDLKPGLPLCNAFALLRENPGSVPAGSFFCTLGSYLSLRLAGENVCHLSCAGPTGCADVVAGTWNMPVIEAAGLGGLHFPRIAPRGQVSALLRLDGRAVPLFPEVGDQQMTILGSLMQPETDVNLNIATAAQLARISGVFTRGPYETRPFFEGMYLNTVTRLPAGRNLEVLYAFMEDVGQTLFRQGIPRAALFARVDEAAREAGGGLAVGTGFFQDALDGEHGIISGITGNNLTVGNLFLSAFANMADSYSRHLGILAEDGTVRRIVATGSVALKNRSLLDLVSRRITLPIHFPPFSDEVLLGHYRLFLLDAERCTTLEETRLLMRDCPPAGLRAENTSPPLPAKAHTREE